MNNQYTTVLQVKDWELQIDAFGSLYLKSEWHCDTPVINKRNGKPSFFSYHEPELIDESFLQYMRDNIESINALVEAKEAELQLHLTNTGIKTRLQSKKDNTKADGTIDDIKYQVVLFEHYTELVKQAKSLEDKIKNLVAGVSFTKYA